MTDHTYAEILKDLRFVISKLEDLDPYLAIQLNLHVVDSIKARLFDGYK